VVTTDCMEMDAIAKGIGTVKGCVKAVEAGVDLVMVSHIHPLQEQAILKIAEAVENGTISHQQIDQSIARIERMISTYTSWKEIEAIQEVATFVGSKTHQDEMKKIYLDGITLVSGTGGPIQSEDKVLLIYPANEYATMVEDKRYATLEMAENLKSVHTLVDVIEIENKHFEEAIFKVANQVVNYDRIVVLTLNAVQHVNQQKLVHQLIDCGKPVDVVAIRTPYDAAMFPLANRMICTYEFTQTAFQVVAEYLVGKTDISGRLPVSLT